MRLALRFLLPALVLLGPMQGRASAVTIQELLEFKGKLSDDVLVALIESDGSVFHLSIGDVASLKDKGLSEKVILAMLKTATKQQMTPAPPPMAAQPQPVYTQPPADPYGQPVAQYPQDQPTMIPSDVPDQSQSQQKAPVVVNVKQEVTQHVDQPQQQYAQPGYAGYPLGYYGYGGYIGAPVVNRPVAQPVYWGWNGQRRPDSWQPTPAPRLPNQAISPMNQAVSPMQQPSTTRTTTNNGRGGGE
ncbi:MAG TPA: hypothetical protein VJN96_19815 [Vicinamibacterales bacterium]|nr:hypothetical protein [Vicinamibacterales bacterium]